jgi:hypothetical protein
MKYGKRTKASVILSRVAGAFLLLSTLKSAHSTGRGRSNLAEQDNDVLFPNAG